MFKFFLCALGLHIALLLLLFSNLNFFSKKQPVSANNPIKAVAINPAKLKAAEETKLNAERAELQKKEEHKKQEEAKKHAEQKKIDILKKAEEAKLDAQKKSEQKKPEKKKIEEKKEKLDTEEQMIQKQMEQKKKQVATKKAQEKTLQEQIAAEETAVSAEASAAMQGEVDKYKGLILEALQQHWIVPDNITPDLSATLLIRLAPGGMVLDVKLVKSSGDAALDRSAIAAVHKASPLPVPEDPKLFDQIREISLIVKPESK